MVGYIILRMGYARSTFREFKSYCRIVVGLKEADIQLILNQYNSFFVTSDLSPGICTIGDFSEAVYIMGDHEGTLQIEYDVINMKTKLVSTRFGRTRGTLNLMKNLFWYFIGIYTVLGL